MPLQWVLRETFQCFTTVWPLKDITFRLNIQNLSIMIMTGLLVSWTNMVGEWEKPVEVFLKELDTS